VIGYYARRIAREVKLPSQFAALVPKVREFLETKAFGGPVNLETKDMVKAIGSNVCQYVTVRTFVQALRDLVVEELEPQLLNAGRRLSETPPFPWSRPTVQAAKCVSNHVPCANKFEQEFARFLEQCDDVVRFAKLPERFGFSIEYTDNAGNLRYYEPDFVAVVSRRDLGRNEPSEAEGEMHYLVETKGLEDVNVAHKDNAARLWCDNASRLTGIEWGYLKVPQTEYVSLQPAEFADLLALESH
jgi:type III restriction enzyme